MGARGHYIFPWYCGMWTITSCSDCVVKYIPQLTLSIVTVVNLSTLSLCHPPHMMQSHPRSRPGVGAMLKRPTLNDMKCLTSKQLMLHDHRTSSDTEQNGCSTYELYYERKIDNLDQ